MTQNALVYVVNPADRYTFLRDVLRSEMDISRSLLIRLKAQNKIKVNGEVTRTNYRLQPGDVVTVELDLDEKSQLIPEDIPIEVIYEDQDYLVVNKPAGLAVHPAKGTASGTLANAVTHYWGTRGEHFVFRPINRLDKDTSGLVLIGKSQYAHQAIFKQQESRTIRREYVAVVDGVMEEDSGSIDLPIALQDPDCRQRIVAPTGKPAVTDYVVLERYANHTLLSLTLRTGRTHQIRVHLSHIGHPITGDPLYGTSSPLINRQALHAGKLIFTHPRTGASLNLVAPLPGDMARLLDLIGQREME